MNTWQVRESELTLPSANPDVRSTLFCIGNGRSTTRGTFAEERYPAYRGVYLSGLYTRAPWGLVYFMGGPDWLTAFLRVAGQVLTQVEASERVLDMQAGVLTRTAVFQGAHGLRVKTVEERFASFAHKNVMGQRLTVEVLAGSGTLEVALGVDGETRNHRAKYVAAGQFPNSDETGLKLTQVEHLQADAVALAAVLAARARETQARAAVFAQVRQTGGPELPASYRMEDGRALQVFAVDAASAAGQALVFEKVAVLTGDLPGFEDAVADGHRVYGEVAGASYDKLSGEHRAAIGAFWETADVVIDGHEEEQRGVRYAIWATRIAAASDGGRSSVGAKNLSGDWYRGAVFWDMEMYQLPLLAAVAPELARNHVLYRANRLHAARTLAAQDGYEGCRFPWQSYGTGLEEPPVFGGFLYQQIHLNVAVPAGIAHYYHMTGDKAFMLEQGGLELMIELARYWASRVSRGEDGTYHIKNCCGPDENHPGIDDNAYTNRLVRWVMGETRRLLEEIAGEEKAKALCARLEIGTAALARWAEIAEKLHIPFWADKGIMYPCAGYEKLPEPDDALKDNSLGGDRRFKQADTLMTFQALPLAYSEEEIARHWAEYAPLCDQTSSLSLSTHALLAIRLRLLRDAKRLFRMTTGADLNDVMGNTCDGIHGAAQGGIWMSTVQGFGGLRVDHGRAVIDPVLPPWYKGLAYHFMYHGQKIGVKVGPERFSVVNKGKAGVTLELAGKKTAVAAGQTVNVPHQAAWKDAGLQGVVFDLDGVLVTTDRFHYQAWKELADEVGLKFDEEINHQLRGVSREDSLRAIYRNNPGAALPDEATFTAYCTKKNERYKALVNAMTPADVLPGALELLQALRAAGIKVAIASASKNCRAVLDRTGLAAWVDAVSDGNNIIESKPNPSVFYVAAQRLRLLPWNCVGVEDAATGIESIRRAGMAALGIGTAATGADVTVGHIREVTVASLRKLFAEYASPLDPYLERSVAHIQKHDLKGKK